MKRSQNSLFIAVCLSITIGLVSVYAVFVGHFNGHQQYEARLSQLQKQVEKERFNTALLNYQLKDFQQTVAQVLPDEKKLQAHYEMRNLASVVRVPASVEEIDLSAVLYERAKKSFNKQDYEKSIAEFYRLLNQYPVSQYSVEARFFIAESYFLRKDYRNSLNEIDQMVTQYPQHDLTGFILLRMGQISELNSQSEEASEIYKTVLKNFKNPELRQQAQKLAKSIEY
ncbi:MAG: outer membrane protein assembly factor BamD [Bdellovibrio sp.]